MSTCSPQLRWKPVDPDSPTIHCAKCDMDKPREEFYATRHRQGCRACRLTPTNRARIRKQDERPMNRYSRTRAQARHRDIHWDLPFEVFAELITKSCTYCDGPLEPTGGGMDRVHGSLGYITENVVPCCSLCNTIKQRVYTTEEMSILGKAVRQIRALRAARGLPAPVSQAYYYKGKYHESRREQETA